MKKKYNFFTIFLLSLIFISVFIPFAGAAPFTVGDPPYIPPPPPPPTAPYIPPVYTSPIVVQDPGDEIPGGSTVFPDIEEFANLDSELGNFAKLKDDYFKVTLGSTGDANVRKEIGGISIVSFENDGIVGYAEDGNPLYKYRMRCEFYILVYTTYSVSDFYSLQQFSEKVNWLRVDTAGAMSWGDIYDTYYYNLEYDEYRVNYADLESKPNGGAYDIPIAVEFNVPNSGATLNVGGTDYRIIDVATQIASLSTSEQPAETNIIGSTDAKWSSGAQSGTVTAHTTEKFSDATSNQEIDDDDAKEGLQSELDRVKPGWKSEENRVKITDSTHNTVAMGTNARIASGDSTHSLSGTYNVNVGANVYHYKSDIKIKYAQIRCDIRPLWTGAGVMATSDKVVDRIVGFGVDNYYTKQKLRCEIDVYSKLETLEAEPTPDIFTDPSIPNITEDINFDDSITGDTDVEVQDPGEGVGNQIMDFIQSPEFLWMLAGIGGLVILGVILYLRLQSNKVIVNVR